MPLTDTKIRNATPRDKPYKLYDSNGLFLIVHPNGSRYWRLRYRYEGKEKLFAIGTYSTKADGVGLADARELAAKARKQVKQGIDPVIKRQETKAENIEKHRTTFKVVANEWLAEKAKDWSPSYTEKATTLLSRNIFPKLGKFPITSITPAMIVTAVKAIEARGAAEQARRALRFTKAICRYASVIGAVDSSPALDVFAGEVLSKRKAKSHPHLTRDQLGDFLRKLAEYHGRPETRIAVNMLLLTAVRTGELRAAKWEEIDFQHKQWRIPAERMKMREEHVVPLSRQVIALLKELKEYSGYSDYLFPGVGRPFIGENTVGKVIKILGYGGLFVGHGARATFSTIANEAATKEGESRFSPDVIEHALAHKDPNVIRGIYNRAKYHNPRRQLMQWWADELDVLQHGGKVIPFTKGG